MPPHFQTKIKDMSQRLIHNMELMETYAKFEVTARDTIPEALLYGDSMKALDRAVKRLNEQHKARLS